MNCKQLFTTLFIFLRANIYFLYLDADIVYSLYLQGLRKNIYNYKK